MLNVKPVQFQPPSCNLYSCDNSKELDYTIIFIRQEAYIYTGLFYPDEPGTRCGIPAPLVPGQLPTLGQFLPPCISPGGQWVVPYKWGPGLWSTGQFCYSTRVCITLKVSCHFYPLYLEPGVDSLGKLGSARTKYNNKHWRENKALAGENHGIVLSWV